MADELSIITKWLNSTVCREAKATGFTEARGKVLISYNEFGQPSTFEYRGSLAQLMKSNSILN